VEEKKQKVLILGDWDADGVVATALLTYSQEYAKKFLLFQNNHLNSEEKLKKR
jgi:single-stranded DNA-specific DHH superfamily exonuclease